MSSKDRDKEDEEPIPDTLVQAGILESNIGATFDQQLASIDPSLKMELDPRAHDEVRPEIMVIREELRQAKWQTLAVRRVALKKLLLRDFVQEDCELRNLGLAYHPLS